MRPRAPGLGGMRRGFKAMTATIDIASENDIVSEIVAVLQPEEKNICKLPPVRPSPIQCLGNYKKETVCLAYTMTI